MFPQVVLYVYVFSFEFLMLRYSIWAVRKKRSGLWTIRNNTMTCKEKQGSTIKNPCDLRLLLRTSDLVFRVSYFLASGLQIGNFWFRTSDLEFGLYILTSLHRSSHLASFGRRPLAVPPQRQHACWRHRPQQGKSGIRHSSSRAGSHGFYIGFKRCPF